MTYFVYNKPSSKGLYLGMYIDQEPQQFRRSAVQNYWTVICSRPLTEIEKDELYMNLGCDKRRFITYYYKDIDYMIFEDLKYGVNTPEKYIDYCKKNNLGQGKTNIQNWEDKCNKAKGIITYNQQLSLAI